MSNIKLNDPRASTEAHRDAAYQVALAKYNAAAEAVDEASYGELDFEAWWYDTKEEEDAARDRYDLASAKYSALFEAARVAKRELDELEAAKHQG